MTCAKPKLETVWASCLLVHSESELALDELFGRASSVLLNAHCALYGSASHLREEQRFHVKRNRERDGRTSDDLRARMTKMFLFDGPEQATHTILLAHGAGAPMDSAAMTAAANALARSGLRTARFEFAYMAGRRSSAARKPPPRAEKLTPEYIAAIDALGAKGSLIIGGKSMGGRVASMIADDLHASGRVSGLLCLGYPFHPIGKPEQLRTAHLAQMKTPTLIAQGTRDPFGSREEVAAYKLSKVIEILWLEDGDHDLRPRKRVSGFSAADHLKTLGDTAAAWANSPPVRAD